MSSDRQPAGTGFAIRDPLSWTDLSAIVSSAEQAGYRALFLPEILGRDALVTLGALAGETRALQLGTGVIPMRSRTPRLTAMAAATVHERSGGRLILGIGTGGSGRGALDALRATVTEVRALLAGEPDEEGAQLSLDPGKPTPIWVAALGPRAMRLAGEIADGVILNMCTPERIPFARARIAEGADASGRDPSQVAVSVYVRSWVGGDERVGGDETQAISALKAVAGQYASYVSYRRQFDEMGLGPQASVAGQAYRAGRPEDVPEVLVRTVCAVGDEARAHVETFREAGADLPIVYPVATADVAASIRGTLMALAPS